MCIDPYSTVEQQIHTNTILSRQVHEEEHALFRRPVSQLMENK